VSNAELLRSLPKLREHATRRYMIGGTPDDCVTQIRAAGEAGARKFWWTVSFPEKMEFVRRFAAEVMTPLRTQPVSA
jgi:alkanesulfonate monooxygenase SsuD/methylene tetrahydromethanopterin reductase-like flavin-dependent oxidoreductase (luciferase family)